MNAFFACRGCTHRRIPCLRRRRTKSTRSTCKKNASPTSGALARHGCTTGKTRRFGLFHLPSEAGNIRRKNGCEFPGLHHGSPFTTRETSTTANVSGTAVVKSRSAHLRNSSKKIRCEPEAHNCGDGGRPQSTQAALRDRPCEGAGSTRKRTLLEAWVAPESVVPSDGITNDRWSNPSDQRKGTE
jgi:hypothetical protein